LWNPAADVYRMRDGWLVKVDLAGVCPDDIEIHANGNFLQIAGVRRDSSYRESIACQQLEITYSRFEKTLEFPRCIEGNRVSRVYKDGLLLIHLYE
jgi:HSP20 family protein